MKRILIIAAALAVLACAGCQGGPWGRDKGNFVKPTIAVMKFENRAPFPVGWDLSGGMRDVLVDRLVATGRFQVIERPELDSILRELRFQQSGATRNQARAKLGRIKNVEYLVKGTVTDFGHVSSSSGSLGLGGLDFFGGGTRAVMSMTLYVVDVESGEIVCSESLEESVRAKDIAVKVAYKDVAFGGKVFYKTPLGRATAKVIDRAVRRVSKFVAARPWEPKIAAVQPDGQVILNGGQNRGVQLEAVYEVVEAGAPIIDPDTGDPIGAHPGKILGRLRIVSVRDQYAISEILVGEAGSLKIGQRCRKIDAALSSAMRAN